MRRTAHKHSQDDGQQLLFSDQPTVADRTATGELIDMSQSAQASGFRWPLAVSATLHHDVQTIPRGCGRTEMVPQRWKHVFLLAATAAAQLQRDGQAEHRMNVVLRTSAAPELPANRIVVERERLGLPPVHPLLHWKLPPPPPGWLTPAVIVKMFELALHGPGEPPPEADQTKDEEDDGFTGRTLVLPA